MYEHSSKESNSATDNNMSGTSESGSTSNDDDFDEFLSFLSPPPQTRTPTETEREIVIGEEKDEDEGTHHTSDSNTISASATPLNFFPTVDEGEVLGIDSSWPTSTSYGPEVKLNNNNTTHDNEIRDTETRTSGYHNNTVAGLLLLHNINRIVIEDIEAGRIPDYHHCQHTETETSSSNPDPFIVEAFQRYKMGMVNYLLMNSRNYFKVLDLELQWKRMKTFWIDGYKRLIRMGMVQLSLRSFYPYSII